MSSHFLSRPYQTDCVRVLLSNWRSTLDPALVSMAVGAGKTVIMRLFVDELKKIKPDVKILILTPKNILVEQTEDKIGDSAVYNAGLDRREIGNITIATVQSFWKIKQHYNAVLIDETHRWSKYHKEIIKNAKELNPKVKVIGFTATPFTGNHSPIYGPEQFFKKINFELSMKTLTQMGFLSPIIYKETKNKPDLD